MNINRKQNGKTRIKSATLIMKNGLYILLHHICRTDISSSYMSLNVTGVSETQIGKLEVKARRVL